MADSAGPSSVTPASALGMLTSLPLTHPAFYQLLTSLSTLAQPSALPHSQLNKLLSRLNASALSKESEAERKAAFRAVRAVVEMDEEGYALNNYGKGWINATLGALTSGSLVVSAIAEPLRLLSTIVITAAAYPSFEREQVQPLMGKITVTLSKLLDRCIGEAASDLSTLGCLIETIHDILVHSPAPFRPTVPALKALLRSIILNTPPPVTSGPSSPLHAPPELRQEAAKALAALHTTSGKAQSPAAWSTAVREALGGIAEATSSIVRDGWQEDAGKIAPPAVPAGLPALPAEPALRLVAALDWLEGFTEETLALVQYPTSRPVPIPLAQIVTAALRCLNVTYDTPTVPYITPQQHAALLASLPRIWTCGLLILGSAASTCGDHLLPHLSNILDHTTWLTERVPSSMTETHVQLLHFHRLIFELYPPALAPIEYPTRLLRFCLAQYSPLLDPRSNSRAELTNGSASSGGKRGKKRARGAEDGLIGGLEGRKQRALGSEDVEVIVASAKLAALLHAAPLLAPSLLTFSIRLHLSLHLQLAALPASTFSKAEDLVSLQVAIADVLDQALYLSQGDRGTMKGWKAAIVTVLNKPSTSTHMLLHPALPPLMRPLPPLDSLHYFGAENEEERKLRLELGYGTANDAVESDIADDSMDVEPQQEVLTVTQVTQETVSVPTAIPTLSFAPPLPAASELLPSETQRMPDDQMAEPAPVPAVPVAVMPGGMIPDPKLVAALAAAEDSEVPFMAVGGSGKGKEKELVSTTMVVDDDDEPLPELDSGSSAFGSDDEDEEADE